MSGAGWIKFLAWLVIGAVISLALFVGSNVGHKVTRQNQLNSDWNLSHPPSSSLSPGPLLTQKRSPLPEEQPLARISLPSTNWSAIVLEGTSNQVLSGGPGHLVGTAYPGEPDNVVISDRNSYSQQWSGVGSGQVIQLDTEYGGYAYTITSLRVLEADDLTPTASTGRPTLTFITCYPLYLGALALQRYVVTAALKS